MNQQPVEPSIKASIDEPTSAGPAEDGGWQNWRTLTTDAYARFQEKLQQNRQLFPPLADYAAVERVAATHGTPAWWWGAAGEVRETINSINAWGARLHDWGAWNLVVDSYENSDDRWNVLHHFVEPNAFFCMLQPSSLADRLVVVSEALIHQANLRVFSTWPDRLDQDRLNPGKTLRRSDRRKQLNRLGEPWGKFSAFRKALDDINGAEYEKVTRNFRDLSAHSFAPRLMAGLVVRAIRSIAPLQEMVPQSNGTYLPVDHPTKKVVQYAMHSIEPLPLEDTRAANLSEYKKTLITIRAFVALIDELCDRMGALPKTE